MLTLEFEKLINYKAMDEIFLCGPEEMIFSVRDWLRENGINGLKIHFELFTTPGLRTQATSQVSSAREIHAGPKSKATIKLDGITFDFELARYGESILDAALHQGADLPYACKGGVCSTCRAKLISGEVRMDANYALEPDELAKGYILTCQSHPISESVYVDFDAK